MIKVSIVVPSYNVRPYIKQCLKSVVGQTLKEIEIICVDAGSMDGTVEEIEKFAAIDERIRFVHSDIKSYGYQVNLGLSLARGEYAAITESDDYVAEEMYEVLYDLGRSTGAEIVKGDYLRVIGKEDNERKVTMSLLDEQDYYNMILELPKSEGIVKEIIYDHDCNIWSGIYETEFLKRNKILCNETPGAAFQDIGFVLQTLNVAQSIYYVDIPLYQYRYMREGASTLKPEVLQFVYQEVKFLLGKESVKNSSNFPLIMRRLSHIFLHEFGRMYRHYDFHVALEKDYLKIRDLFKSYDADEWDFFMLMNYPETYGIFVSRIAQRQEQWEERIANKLVGREVVIAGYGKRGRHLEKICKNLGISVIARCDNGHIQGVLSMEKCCQMYPRAYYVIASKFYAFSIQKYLRKLGIEQGQMEIFYPLDNFIFYGAGKVGRICRQFFFKHHLEPVCYLDRDASGKSECIDRVPVLSADEFITPTGKGFAKGASVLVTLARGGRQIKDKLEARGFDAKHIYLYENRLEFLDFILPRLVNMPIQGVQEKNESQADVYFDLGNGVVLGGVESWSVEMGNYLKKIGKRVKYVSWRYETDIYKMTRNEVIGLTEDGALRNFEHCLIVAKKLSGEKRFVYVCNFYNMIFDMMVWLKKSHIMDINLIAVVHNDMEGYYETYSKYIENIDYILFMSEKQKKRLLYEYHIPKNKLKFLGWHIPCEENLKRVWSQQGERMKIGYAGRLVLPQKRADLLLRLIFFLLREKNMDISFTIAGDGLYRKQMEAEITRLNLMDRVTFLGQLPKKDMLSFWHKQDVMVSCSDWEGNSISKSEAMAAGAVPVVTDTSGALDDIEPGVNGYIVPVGDISSMVRCIDILYRHRELLPRIGGAAHEKILANNRNFSIEMLWEELLSVGKKYS